MSRPVILRIDCGVHGMLTIAEIAAHAGISETGIHMRRRAGYVGEELLVSRQVGGRRRADGSPARARPLPPMPAPVGVVDTGPFGRRP